MINPTLWRNMLDSSQVVQNAYKKLGRFRRNPLSIGNAGAVPIVIQGAHIIFIMSINAYAYILII